MKRANGFEERRRGRQGGQKQSEGGQEVEVLESIS